RYMRMNSSYFRNANGVIVVYDVSSRESFLNTEHWINAISDFSNENVHKVLVGNKCDLEERAVSIEEGMKFANFKGMTFYETSAKCKMNIDQLFTLLCNNILNDPNMEMSFSFNLRASEK